MRRPRLKIALLACGLLMSLATQAQAFRNDFENQHSWYPPWTNIRLAADSSWMTTDSTMVRNTYCVCDTTHEFGLGISFPIPDTLIGRNLHLRLEADYRFPDTIGQGMIVFTIQKDGKNRFWQSRALEDYRNDSATWFHTNIEMDFPADYLEGATFNYYLWNPHKNNIHIDNASLELTAWALPSYLPHIDIPQKLPTDDDLYLCQPGDSLNPLTYPIGVVTEYILQGDTVTEFHLFKKPKDTDTILLEFLAVSAIDTTYAFWSTFFQEPNIVLNTHFHKEAKLLRKALVIPFIDSTLTVYRRNLKTDSTAFQPAYYLDREGFKVGEGNRSIVSYHQTKVSSTQLDAKRRIAYFNLDYWRDHPMIHYPLNDNLEDSFEDISYRPVESGDQWTNWIDLYIGDEINNLPRIMPIPYGYESGIIFTEHADWTDLRTHRAILFGSDKITKARKATGGFVHYGIPVTKSVFYNNPDSVTNNETSLGAFTGLHATIKTDWDFEKLLKQLQKNGFEICLHTPEQYTTTPSNLDEAMRYMEKQFNSTSWIDHGYNNGQKHNREDLVCDGLKLSADLWQQHGVKYLWNAYYEENRMSQWEFDNNLMQPYPGFGDALPNRQVTNLVGYDHSSFAGLAPSLEPEFLTWATPSTFEASSDKEWDYHMSEERLQKIVENHDVFITHTYPAWVVPGRTFWTYDEDSTIVALPGMNRALERIAALRDEHKMLPMTVKTYLDYYSALLQVDYEIIDAEHIRLLNSGNKIKGFTLVSSSPIRFEGNHRHKSRKSGDLHYVWFDIKAHESVVIIIN